MLGLLRSAPNDAQLKSFAPAGIRLDDAPLSPLPGRILVALLALLAVLAAGMVAGRLDIVAIAEGKLVPRNLVKIVQPAEAGVVREVLVEEGAAVVAGQPLLRLDARIADAEVRAHRIELAQRQLQIRRIDAELAGRALTRHAGDADEAYATAVAQHRANREALRDALDHASAQLARTRQELSAAAAIEAKLVRTVPIAQTMAARYETLRAEGFVSELFALERVRDRIAGEQDLQAQRHAVAASAAGVDQANRQLSQIVSNARRQLHAERADAQVHVGRLREQLDKQLVRREHVDLVAPQAGIVKELAIRTVGGVVAAGTVLVTLVPAGEPLEAEVLIRNVDAGFVHAGQRVQLKVGAFPFQKYGLVDATVLRVGVDAAEPAAASSAADEQASGFYRARLELGAQSLPFDGVRLPLVSGMAAVAEIHLGHRSVLDYLLAPVQKAWHEAGRER